MHFYLYALYCLFWSSYGYFEGPYLSVLDESIFESILICIFLRNKEAIQSLFIKSTHNPKVKSVSSSFPLVLLFNLVLLLPNTDFFRFSTNKSKIFLILRTSIVVYKNKIMQSGHLGIPAQDDTNYLSIQLKPDEQEQIDFYQERYWNASPKQHNPKIKLVLIFAITLAVIGLVFLKFTGTKNDSGIGAIQSKMEKSTMERFENAIESQAPVIAPTPQETRIPTSSIIKGAHDNAQTARSKIPKKYRNYKLPRTSQQFSGTVVVNK